MRRVALVFLAALVSCSDRDARPPATPHDVGAESFVSPDLRGRSGVPTAGDVGAPGAGAPDEASSGGGPRAIVEADLYVRDGTLLYVQNAWRGLQIVDVSDPAAPRIRGRVPLTGTPVGLYLRGGVALVASRDHYAWIPALDAAGPGRAEVTSHLWAVDVSNPDAPAILADVTVPGSLTESRLVGDVLYAVTLPSTWGWWALPGGGGGVAVAADATSEPAPNFAAVLSYAVADPRAPALVDEVVFDQAGWTTHANVTPERITVAQVGWNETGPVTRLTAVDSSDPAGALERGASKDVAGLVQDRWGMDLDAATGTFRVVVNDGWNEGARLVVLDWATPGRVADRATLRIDVPESLTAARFDGPRVYAVTAVTVDPLWVIDANDPSAPFLAGHLEMPGRLDYVEPRGDRLLALGHTDEAGGVFQLHVSLLDVSDPAKPALLSRKVFGPDWAFVPASSDDVRKAFQVIDAEGLILVPYEGFDRAGWTWKGGTQLVGFDGSALSLGGFVPHAGAIKRAFPLGAPGLLGAFSDEKLQTIDARDRAHPVELASIDLARWVNDLAVVGDVAVELSGDWWRGGELVVVPAADPDAADPGFRLPIAGGYARMFRVGSIVWALGADWGSGGAFLTALDVSNPAAPRARGRLTLGGDGAYHGWGDAVQVGAALAVLRYGDAAQPSLVVVDLADPDAPRVSATVPLPASAWLGPVAAAGTSVWYSRYEYVTASWEGPWSGLRYAVGRVDLADPAAPVAHAPVNVPGWFFAAGEDGRTIYTAEADWADGGATPTTWLHALALTDHGTARLLASARVDGWTSQPVRAGSHAYALTSVPTGASSLVAVALDGMKVVSADEVPVPAYGAEAAGGKLFVRAYGAGVGAILVYGLSDPARPAFERSVQTAGWVSKVVVEEGVAYLAAGPYGVHVVPLDP